MLLLPIAHDMRIEAEAGIVQENAPVDDADIDVDHVRRRDRAHGFGGVEGDTQVFREVIERAERQHAKRRVTPCEHRSDGVQRTVPAGCHHRRWFVSHGIPGELDELGTGTRSQNAGSHTCRGENFIELSVIARCATSAGVRVHDYGERRHRGAALLPKRCTAACTTAKQNASHAVLQAAAPSTSLR